MLGGWGSVFFCLIVSGCTPDVEQVDSLAPRVVAWVDSVRIVAAELRSFVEEMPARLRSRQLGSGARDTYLRSLLAGHLLEIEARERGLDTSPEVQADLMTRWRQHIVEVYRREVLIDQVQITEADIRAYFEGEGWHRQRQVAGILVDEEARAYEIRARLEAGEDFEVLARQYSIDERSLAQGGLLGFIDMEQAHKLQIPAAVFLDLETGQISEVLPMGKRYQVVRFLQDRPVRFEDKRQQIYALLYERRLAEVEQQEIRHLERKLRLRLVPEGIKVLRDKAGLYTRVQRTNLSASERVQPLFTYKGGVITLGDYVDILGRDMRSLTGWGVQDGTEVEEAAGELILGKWLLFEAARRAAITDGREEQRWLAENRRELMIKWLRQREIVDKAVVDREEARDYYDDNPGLFRATGEYILTEVLVETEEQASVLRKQIGSGETISSLAQKHTLDPDMREEAGMTHLGEYERLTRPLMYKAAQEAELDEVIGPLEVEGGFTLFKVLSREGGEVRPFAEVEARARALLRGQKKELLFEEWIDTLMDKYEDRIIISEQELAHALPDTLLQRLDRASRE